MRKPSDLVGEEREGEDLPGEIDEESDGDEKDEMRVLDDAAGSEPGVRSDAGVDGDATPPCPATCRCRCMSLL